MTYKNSITKQQLREGVSDLGSQVNKYEVWINGNQTDIYACELLYPPYEHAKKLPYAYFDLDGSADIRVRVPFEIRTAVIQPYHSVPKYQTDGRELHFQIDHPAQLAITLNENLDETLHLFANPCEPEPAKRKEKDLLYFGPGVHEAGVIRPESGQTVYLAEGAMVYGEIHADHVRNLHICGRGTLSAERIPRLERFDKRCVDIIDCEDVTISGIIIHDSPTWTVRIMGCRRVQISNIKIFGWRENSDGIDICGSREVRVDSCFIRNRDDSLVVKGFDTGDVEQVRFTNCTIWNDFGRPMEVGYENRADSISQVCFENITVIRSLSGYPIMGIHEGDRADIHHIYFRNIRIEEAEGSQLFDLRIRPSFWNESKGLGKIHHIYFENIQYVGKEIKSCFERSRIQGYGEENTVGQIYFKNIEVLGKKISSAAECQMDCLEYTHDITFESDGPALPIPIVDSRITIRSRERQPNGYETILFDVILTNTSASDSAEGRIRIGIWPDTLADQEETYTAFRLAPLQQTACTYVRTLRPNRYVACVHSDYFGFRRAECLFDVELHLTELEQYHQQYHETALAGVPVIPVYHNKQKAAEVRLARYKDQLVIEAVVADNAGSGVQGTPIEKRNFQVQNRPYLHSGVELFVADMPEISAGDMMFLIPETMYAQAPSFVAGEEGVCAAPEIRNILEVTMVFHNQPKVKHLIRKELPETKSIRGQAARTYSAVIPFGELQIREGKFLLEMLFHTVLPGTGDYVAVPMFGSLKPDECVQMYGTVNGG